MRKVLAGLLAAVWGAAALAQPLPEVAVGRIERLPTIASRFVDARPVDVWLPAGYSTAKRYDVLYMHDGQMLYDAGKSWNGLAWGVHLALDRLVKAGRVPDTIVVGVWNNGPQRYAEYYPQKMLALAPEPVRREYVERASNGRSQSDAYLRFLVEEVKPEIDRRYATRPGREHTHLMGSSMGGLISVYALCEYPQVFGAAAALSTHWVGIPTAWGPERSRNAALPLAAMNYLAQHLPDPATHRLYTDRGTVDLDGLYAPGHAFVAELLRDRGYTAAQATTRIVEGGRHTETDWAARLDDVLPFLLGPR
jgi:enterochelin esterase-like enzyme